jgi:hypothetical protein
MYRPEQVHFKIRSIATAYRIDIYRMGYYGGLGARLVHSMRPGVPLPQPQPECLYEAATRLVDCATWAVSASWSVPAAGWSGICQFVTNRASHLCLSVCLSLSLSLSL